MFLQNSMFSASLPFTFELDVKKSFSCIFQNIVHVNQNKSVNSVPEEQL